MTIYYYAFTGHKYGLDRARRAAVILKGLKAKGFNTMLLVNDFRAGLATRDLGVPESVHIEGIQDIDAIAEVGDVAIIDSPEDDHGRLVKYCSDFKHVFRFAEHDEDTSIHGETMLTIDCNSDECISSIIVDDIYFETHQKEQRTLFFLGDSDADKTILNNSDFFNATPMELLLGNYFYVKYENDLEKIFETLHESEEYTELICSSSRVITASFQTALEAKVAGAEVIFINLSNISDKQKKLLSLLKVILISNFNIEIFKQIALNPVFDGDIPIERNDTIVTKIINCF